MSCVVQAIEPLSAWAKELDVAPSYVSANRRRRIESSRGEGTLGLDKRALPGVTWGVAAWTVTERIDTAGKESSRSSASSVM